MKLVILFIGVTLNIAITGLSANGQMVDLDRVGDSLATRLAVPMGTSDDLINDLIEYYVYVKKCLRRKNVKGSKERKLIQKLLKNNGPPHIKVQVTDKFLKKNYNLSAVEVDEIRDVLVDTKILWKNMRNITLE